MKGKMMNKSSVNDLLQLPLLNETSEDEIMHDQVDQNEFENSDEDQIMQRRLLWLKLSVGQI